MNFKGDSLDTTDIEGATAGTAADPIIRFRQRPLNPLSPDYDLPGDTELTGRISRRHAHNQNIDNSDRRQNIKSNIRLIQSIRNSQDLSSMNNRNLQMSPSEVYNTFENRNHSVSGLDKNKCSNSRNWLNNLNRVSVSPMRIEDNTNYCSILKSRKNQNRSVSFRNQSPVNQYYS